MSKKEGKGLKSFNKGFQVPDTYIIIFLVVVIAALLTFIQKIISYQRNNQQNETKDNSHCLINIRTFQLPTISFQ